MAVLHQQQVGWLFLSSHKSHLQQIKRNANFKSFFRYAWQNSFHLLVSAPYLLLYSGLDALVFYSFRLNSEIEDVHCQVPPSNKRKWIRSLKIELKTLV